MHQGPFTSYLIYYYFSFITIPLFLHILSQFTIITCSFKTRVIKKIQLSQNNITWKLQLILTFWMFIINIQSSSQLQNSQFVNQLYIIQYYISQRQMKSIKSNTNVFNSFTLCKYFTWWILHVVKKPVSYSLRRKTVSS